MDRKVPSEVLEASVPTEPLATVAAYPLTALNRVSRVLAERRNGVNFSSTLCAARYAVQPILLDPIHEFHNIMKNSF